MKMQYDFSELVEFGNRLADTYSMETALMTATQNIARVLHKILLSRTPIKTGNLRKMWSAGENLAFTVEKFGYGYRVTLINRAQNDKGFKYGIVVNDGSPSRNIVGRFFVEASIALTLPQVEQIVMQELRKWWDSI